MTLVLLVTGVLVMCGGLALLLASLTGGDYSGFYWFAALVTIFIGGAMIGAALTLKRDRDP